MHRAGRGRQIGQLALFALAFALVVGGGRAADAPAQRPAPAEKAMADGLIRRLYKAPATGPIRFRAAECGQDPCRVRLLAEETWPDSVAGEQRLLVTAAEPRAPAAHASGAVLGIGLFQKRGGRWSLEAGSAHVDVEGSYGTAPEVEIVQAGLFGRGVVTKPGFTAQGVTEAYWILFLPIQHEFRQTLKLDYALDQSGMCQPGDTACLAQDFSSEIAVAAVPDGITVTQMKTGPASDAHRGCEGRWHVSRSGGVRMERAC